MLAEAEEYLKKRFTESLVDSILGFHSRGLSVSEIEEALGDALREGTSELQ